MQDMDHRFTAAEGEMNPKTAAALASIAAEERRRAAAGYGLMAGMMGFGESAEKGRMKKIVTLAQQLCIAFAFLVPNLLLIRVVW